MHLWSWFQGTRKSPVTIDRERSARLRLEVENLESRTVMSASTVLDAITADPALSSLAVTRSTPVGLTPAQVLSAYGFNQISFSGIKGTGAGQTIAIVDAYDDPNIASDLHVFDQTFGIADPPNFSVFKQYVNGVAPKTDSGWAMEIALDVEWAHAIAPDANIILVEANTSSLSNLLSAVDYARSIASVSVISMSWGSSEFLSETSYDSHFTTPAGHQGITFVVASGDAGAPAEWPAVSPNVLAVGGTTLNVSTSGTYISESAWSDSGGGYSRYESEPSYQSSVQSSKTRSNPDVAYDASPSTGFAVYDTVASSGQSGWFEVGGTSAGAPQWAALVAIADQGRVLAGKTTLANAQVPIYSLPSTDFHDVTSGSNGYSASKGYDLVTGRGTPIANAVVRDLVSYTGSTSYTLTASSTSSHRVIFVFTYGFGSRATDAGDSTSAALPVLAATLTDGTTKETESTVVSNETLVSGVQMSTPVEENDILLVTEQLATYVPAQREKEASLDLSLEAKRMASMALAAHRDQYRYSEDAAAVDDCFEAVVEENVAYGTGTAIGEESPHLVDVHAAEWSAEYLAMMVMLHVNRSTSRSKTQRRTDPMPMSARKNSPE